MDVASKLVTPLASTGKLVSLRANIIQRYDCCNANCILGNATLEDIEATARQNITARRLSFFFWTVTEALWSNIFHCFHVREGRGETHRWRLLYCARIKLAC